MSEVGGKDPSLLRLVPLPAHSRSTSLDPSRGSSHPLGLAGIVKTSTLLPPDQGTSVLKTLYHQHTRHTLTRGHTARVPSGTTKAAYESLHSEETRLRRGEGPHRGEVAPLAPAPALRSWKGSRFSKWPAGRGRTPTDFSGQTDLRRPRSRDPKPALKRKQATCSLENRTRNSPRAFSPLSGYQLGIRLPWPGYRGVTQQVRPPAEIFRAARQSRLPQAPPSPRPRPVRPRPRSPGHAPTVFPVPFRHVGSLPARVGLGLALWSWVISVCQLPHQ